MAALLTRRAALAGLAALPAASLPTRASAEPDVMSALIEDWRAKEARWSEVCERISVLLATLPLPEVSVRWPIQWPDGSRVWRKVTYRYEQTVLDQLDQGGVGVRPEIERRLKRILRRLRRQHRLHAAGRKALGIDQLEQEEDAAYDARIAAFDRILACQPASITEMRIKHAFLAEQLRDGCEFGDEALAMIFGAAERQDGVSVLHT